MGIKLVIAVTDGDWFERLRRQPDLGEVNFWAPSAANFRALQPGELFLFKRYAPHNVIVGGGKARCGQGLGCELQELARRVQSDFSTQVDLRKQETRRVRGLETLP